MLKVLLGVIYHILGYISHGLIFTYLLEFIGLAQLNISGLTILLMIGFNIVCSVIIRLFVYALYGESVEKKFVKTFSYANRS